MSEAQSGSRTRVAWLVGGSVLVALHGLGVFAYLTRNVLRYPWLWDNPDYMLFLNAAYAHLHAVVLAGHLYLWGPYLIAKAYRRRWWSLYYVSLAAAFGLTLVPLLSIQRFEAIYGTLAYRVIELQLLLLLLFLSYYLAASRSRPTIVALHVFSGFPVTTLFFLTRGTPHSQLGYTLATILLFHLVAAWYVNRAQDPSLVGRATQPEDQAQKLRPVWLVNGALLVIIAGLTLPNFYINLLYARSELRGILDRVGYPRRVAGRASSADPPSADQVRFRTVDGSWNNLEHPDMGKAGTPLGRYLRSSATAPQDVYRDPSVLRISDELLKQDRFIPAATSNGTINALAFAWVNFFVHDFYARGTDNFSRTGSEHYKLPVGGGKYIYMSKLPDSPEGRAGSHRSSATHWFDASQVYGSDSAWAEQLRTSAENGAPGAKLRVCQDGFLPKYRPGKGATPPLELFCGRGGQPRDGSGVFLTGDAPRSSLHIGLLLLHTLWVHEHNYIVDELNRRYPRMTNAELYGTARLIVAAEIAKIHTVEWTAQLTSDRISAEVVRRLWADQVGNPAAYEPDRDYAVSEEFVSSYILHEIVPPVFSVIDTTGRELKRYDFVTELFGMGGQQKLEEYGPAQLFNSFGRNPMGLIYPFNVSDQLRHFRGLEPFIRTGQSDDAGYVDLGAIPVARDRDARVPKYNDLREALNLPRLKRIDDISSDPQVVAALKRLYTSVDDIEYIVGYKAESRPSTWGLTMTQVAAFLPVVVYRIRGDRFYTKDFRPEIYTPYGIEHHFGPALLPTDRDAAIFRLWHR
jgi:hypothetical protein